MMTGRATSEPPSRGHVWTTVGYGLLVLGTVGVFLIIRDYGEALQAPPPSYPDIPTAAASGNADIFLRLLVALAVVLVTGQLLGKLFVYVGQPPVIGEVVAGILLGPSLLGAEVSSFILPQAVAPFLGVVAQLGILLYMFLVGLEFNPGLLENRIRATIATSHASILIPFLLGAFLALALYPRLSSSDVPFTSFALFLGAAMSITAFPVLARILTDRRLATTEIGALALSCAAIDDVTAWCLLALVVGVTKAQTSDVLFVVLGAGIYIAVMLLLARPLLRRLITRSDTQDPGCDSAVIMFLALLLSAIATEAIGIHAIFGAFLLGAVVPHDSAVARNFIRQLQPIVIVLLLPAFFALTGMRTRIDLLAGAEDWFLCLVITLVATLGKFGGTVAAARLTGLRWHDAAVLGTLMNTRGLMELIVLNIGLDLKVISPTLFSMMVIMALATTLATSPVLVLLKPATQKASVEP